MQMLIQTALTDACLHIPLLTTCAPLRPTFYTLFFALQDLHYRDKLITSLASKTAILLDFLRDGVRNSNFSQILPRLMRFSTIPPHASSISLPKIYILRRSYENFAAVE